MKAAFGSTQPNIPIPVVSEALQQVRGAQSGQNAQDKAERMLQKSEGAEMRQALDTADQELQKSIEDMRLDAERTREARERRETERLSADIQKTLGAYPSPETLK